MKSAATFFFWLVGMVYGGVDFVWLFFSPKKFKEDKHKI